MESDRRAFLRDVFTRLLPLLAIPLLHCVLILLADPYAMFRLPFTISSEAVRSKFAEPANPALYRYLRFRENPKPDILLGDSRMAVLKPEEIRRQTGKDVASFALPGATFDTVLDAFWLANETAKLRSVLIGVALDSYNDFRIGSEVPGVRSITSNPLLYFTNQNVISSTFEAYKQQLGFKPSNQFQLAGRSKTVIWNGMRRYYSSSLRNYRDPARFRARLKAIVRYCAEHHIEVRFVILPQHDEATRLIQDFGLQEANLAMKRELAEMAELVDLSAPTALTADASHFGDILHFGPERDFRLIARIWPPKPAKE